MITDSRMYTYIPKRFYIGQLGSSNGTLYTAPAAKTVANSVGQNPKAIIRQIRINNTDSGAQTVTLYIVESGGTAADNRAIKKAYSVAANTDFVLTELYDVLEAGDTIQGLASAASKVTVMISGDELLL